MADSSTVSAEVPVLLSFSAFSRPGSLPAGCGRDVILQRFASAYGRDVDARVAHVIQVFSEEWGQYVDVQEDFAVSHTCKLRLVPCCSLSPHDMTPLGNLCQKTTAFFCCDLQERFRPAISYFEDIITVGQRLLQGAGILDIPVIVSEQYPKGLGSTVPELDLSRAKLVFPKTRFSMVLPETEAVLAELPAVRSIVLFGIEAHVCIQQTALDLIGRGYEVHIVADATSSRSMVDRMFAFQRLSRAGAIVTTSEAVLLQLVGDKEHPKFKEVQSVIRTSAPESGLLTKV